MKAPRKPGASELKGHLMRFFRRPGFNPLVQAQPRAREMVRGAGRRDRTHLCLRPPLRKNHLGSGTDGRTDARSTQERVSGFWRGCAHSEPQEVQREGGEGGQSRSTLNGPCPRTHVLLLFALISLQGFCPQRFAVDAGEGALGRRREPGCRRRPLPALCGGTHLTQLQRGQQRWGPRARGQVLAPTPAASQGCWEARGGTWLGTVTVTLVQRGGRRQGVPLVPMSSGCFFQGRPRSFRGGGSGSRRWSCCSRSSRLRAASSTGAGSAGHGMRW